MRSSAEHVSSTRGARAYTLLGVFAVLHAAIIFALDSVLMTHNHAQPAWYPYVHRLNTGLSTIWKWFFWPIILALHAGRSPRRAYLSLGLAAAIFLLPGKWYFEVTGAQLFAPEMIRLSPYDLGGYALASVRGWADARKDVKAGRIILESYGFGVFTPGAPPFSERARDDYRIEINQVTGCVVNTYILGHASGYNRVAVQEIKRRYGPEVITRAEQDEVARQQRWAAMQTAGKAEAQNDIRANRLAIRIYSSAINGEDDYRKMLGERYQVDLQRVWQAPPPCDEDTWARASAYNEVMAAELGRRFGHEATLAGMSVTSGQSYDSWLQRIAFDREHPRNASR